MPTTGSGRAFTKVIEARNELRKIAEELHTANPDAIAGPKAKARYIEARRDLTLAIDTFSATIKNTNGH